ncbi:MAG: undecaprenyl/decaprenyl-phosphate alpha-N-acetylglucosaminyl 1-phosphate transferase [Armatimonadetes bacterium]|nr:undecaprenyl/decaprenyl-phosphate alpha-N-acetylglucosaminyl 1-phosphate transferase [Armatimonadota bacterium]MCX7967280.1 undecaprenyl/decaprenyl-phosphate alpha-N-acetylglucosaminyl 1-phosphate transferase [Armatimonadota bacterium]MDW8141912.1 MraY family glycosyltransferase [Armatimonadota bacterium]
MLTSLALAFLVATVISIVVTPLTIRWAQRFGIVARPSSRKIHHEPVPSWGGIALATATLFGTAVSWLLLKSIPDHALGVLLGLITIVVVGTLDDRSSLSPKTKLLGQIIAAVLPTAFGLRIAFINNPFGEGYIFLATWQAWLLTVFWIVALTNALNLIDGLDGLAAGVSFFASLTLAFLAAGQKLFPIAAAFAAVAGACMGFLPYNFHPARVFMGDTGAMALGYLFATLSIMGAVKSVAALSLFFMTGMVLAYPILDTAFAIARRWLKGRPIFSADREHLHHKLLDSGFDQRQAVLLLYALTLVFCLLALLLVKGA